MNETLDQHNQRVRDEVAAAIERARSLTDDGAIKELIGDTRKIINTLPHAERDALRDALVTAGKERPALPAEAPKYGTVAGLSDMVLLGAQRAAEGITAHIKLSGLAKETAAIILDARRRLKNSAGDPDLIADSQAARDFASDLYKQAGAILVKQKASEKDVKAVATSFQRAVRFQMRDVHTEYLLSLDSDAKERKRYAHLLGDKPDGTPVSEFIADHYGLGLKTNSELNAERYAARNPELSDTGALEIVSAELSAADARVEKISKQIRRADDEERKALKERVRATADAYQRLYLSL